MSHGDYMNAWLRRRAPGYRRLRPTREAVAAYAQETKVIERSHLAWGLAALGPAAYAFAAGATPHAAIWVLVNVVTGRPHTPEYASPEQIAGAPLGIATDVYSLGVVLYELLSGTRPYKPRDDSVRALEAAVLEADPPPPSAAAADRSTRKALHGDLDTIVVKALQKQPAKRYATVNALGDDLERYLSGRPVLARPDSSWYRLSKFVRRNALAASAAVVVMVSLAVFGVVSSWQARVLAEQRRIAQTERDTAEQVVRLLIDLFESTNPAVRPDGERMPRRVPCRCREPLARAAAIHPVVRARLLQVFGLIHQTRGQVSRRHCRDTYRARPEPRSHWRTRPPCLLRSGERRSFTVDKRDPAPDPGMAMGRVAICPGGRSSGRAAATFRLLFARFVPLRRSRAVCGSIRLPR